MPTISVVIPTRDRPLFVREALKSLVDQEFTDFEAIVADNPQTASCEDVVEEFGEERFRYIRAERPLAMNDNWEAGCAAVTGDYVAVMIDKTVWLPSTMSRAMSILEETSASVISWWCSGFDPYDERTSLTSGEYIPYAHHPPTSPMEFSGLSELEKAMAFRVRRGLEGPAYYRGKICFGLYRSDVLTLIRNRIGRLFPPICPDYTSRVGAFLTAPSFVDAGVPLQVSLSTELSNGLRTERDVRVTTEFLDETESGLVDRLPIPGLWAAQHNVVAHDYLIAEDLDACKLDRLNLTARAREDLSLVRWPDARLRREQYRLLADAERQIGRSRFGIWAGHAVARLRPRVAATREALHDLAVRAILRTPRLHRAVRIVRGKLRSVRGKPPVAPPPDASIAPGTLAGGILDAETELRSSLP